MNTPNGHRISVAMCTYNGSGFLAEQLESIRVQTETPYELVVCDDGSSDNTLSLLQAFALTVPFPVRIHQNAERLRFAGNFSKCIRLCQGDVIVLTDQDDLWARTRIQDTNQAYQADPGLTFTFSDAPLIDGKGQPTGEWIYSSFPMMRKDRSRFQAGAELLPVISRWGCIYGCTLSVRSTFAQLVLPVPQGWSHDEWLTLALSALGPSAKLRPQTNYRQHGVNSVGVGDWSAAGHLRLARSRTSDAYEQEIIRCRAGLLAAEANPRLRNVLAPILADKLLFLQKRQQLREKGLGGAGQLLKLLAQGGYTRYGAGPKSVLKDVLMMAHSFHTVAQKADPVKPHS